MNENLRKEKLEELIHETFCYLNTDGWEAIAVDFEYSIVRMIEFTDIYLTSARAIDFDDENIEYSSIFLSPEFSCLLHPQDVFMVRLGMKRGQWHIITMSHLYEQMEFDENEDDGSEDSGSYLM